MPQQISLQDRSSERERSFSLVSILTTTVLPILFFVILLVCVLIEGGAALSLDTAALESALTLRSPALTVFMLQISSIVMPAVLAMVAVALTAFGQSFWPFLVSLGSVAGATGLNWLIKQLVARPRPPEELRLALETSTSFPSSHAVSAVAFYGLIIWFIWHYQHSGTWRSVQIALLVLAIILVGLSRVYLAVHYASDVLAGFCLGIIWLRLYTRVVAARLLTNSLPAM